MKKLTSLKVHIWAHFMIFTIVIMLLLWLLQIVFLQSYYQRMKTRDIKRTAETLLNNYDKEDFQDIVYNVAYSNNMCIVVTDEYGNALYSQHSMSSECAIHGQNIQLHGFRDEILSSENGTIYYQLTEKRFNVKMLFYATYIGDRTVEDGVTGYIFLNTSLEPVGSTVDILKEQLIYITVIIFGLAIIISRYISKSISDPIVKITLTAKDFAEGDYKAKFDGGDYIETFQLAGILNYAGEEISKVSDMKRELLANVSHDLRTPLTMVKAYAELIRDISGDIPEKRNAHVKVIIDEADRLSALVNEILDLSQLENSDYTLNIESFEITKKLDEIMNFYSILSENQGYNFEVIKDAEVNCVADIAKIEQVFYNFINNAVNYCGENKQITIKQINMSEYVRIEITDDGDGISEELLPQIFERYYRDENHKRAVVGTGLGLSIVREILMKHKFPFGVSSELGKGSTFWFEIEREHKSDKKRIWNRAKEEKAIGEKK